MIRTFIALTLVMTILGFSPQPIDAQSDCTEMFYGDSMNGFLDSIEVTEDFEDIYCFFGVEGDTVTITMDITSGTIDPLLFVQISDGTPVADNENRSDGVTDSTLTFTLSVTDWYFIRATQYPYGGGLVSGNYILSLNCSTNNTDTGCTNNDVSTDSTELSGNVCGPSFDDPRLDYLGVDGELTSSDPWAYYYFEAPAGRVYRITLTSSDFDAYLTLYDGSEIVHVNDDITIGVTDSEIVYGTVHDGIYCIEASSFQNEGMGSFTLSFMDLGSGGSLEGANCEVIDLATPTFFSNFEMDGNFCFLAQQGNSYAVWMVATSGDLDTSLTLNDGVGPVAENNDASPNTTNSFVQFTRATFGSVIYIEAGRVSGDGDFMLIVTETEGIGN